MNYHPTIASGVTEVTVYLVFAAVCLNALGQGRRWLSTVICGSLAGYFAEVYIVHQPDPRYVYRTDLFLISAWEVPVCIGVGWGMVFYVATWTAQRLKFRSLWQSSLVAGALGVNLDLSLDPVANLHEFWKWRPLPEQGDSLAGTLFGVPFDNFVAWIALIGGYGFFVRWAFHKTNKHVFGEQSGPEGGASLAAPKSTLWMDLVIPPIAAALAAGLFALARSNAGAVYDFATTLEGWLGQNVGEAHVFSVIFLAAMVLFWWHVFRAARNQEVNWVVLGVVVYFHVLSFGLFLVAGTSEATGLLVMIPMNLVAGFFAFAWASLDSLFERFVVPGPDEFRMPTLLRKTLASYGGVKIRALVATPTNERELRAVLEFAKSQGKHITFRGGGMAFDTQSLNRDIVISFERLNQIALDAERAEVTVGCGATWGAILKTTLPAGLAPHIMVTSSAATAGGTLSANSLTRFSPTLGREGKYVVRFKLLTPDGKLWTCQASSPPNSPEHQLFRAVIGGLGYVGAVLEVTYRLLRLPRENAFVETDFTLIEGVERIAGAIQPTRFSRVVEDLVGQTRRYCSDSDPNNPVALSAALYMRGPARALIASSRYSTETTLRRSVFHTPNSLLHRLLQLFALMPLLRTIGYYLTFRSYSGGTKHYVDEAYGYTFFEDGNRWLRRCLHYLGIPAQILQQTFMIPSHIVEGADSGQKLTRFLEQTDAFLDGLKLEPVLIDVLYVEPDPEPFLLSSSNGFEGFAVTFTFERLFRSLEKERAALTKISEFCEDHGGRVHLVKNVCASKELLDRMYNGAVTRFRSVRDEHQGDGVLENDFSERALGI